jgi:acetyl-CoA decarbonylase/synthase complex subunit delta
VVAGPHSAAVRIVTLGAGRAQGGTRSRPVSIGGATDVPLTARPPSGLRPALALEVWDVVPEEFPVPLGAAFDHSVGSLPAWVRACERYAPDLLCLRLHGTHPDSSDKDPGQAADEARQVAGETGLPIMVVGCDHPEKDALVLPVVCEALEGERCLIGCAVHENYRTLAAAAIAADHSLVAETPIDLNLAKQLNILLDEAGFGRERVVIHHLTSPLGYGLEYTYSIMERSRLAALSGDEYLSQPMVVFVGNESWRVKEATAPSDEAPGWGRPDRRGVSWETTAAVAYLCAGADLIVFSHPESLLRVRKFIDAYWRDEGAVAEIRSALDNEAERAYQQDNVGAGEASGGDQ